MTGQRSHQRARIENHGRLVTERGVGARPRRITGSGTESIQTWGATLSAAHARRCRCRLANEPSPGVADLGHGRLPRRWTWQAGVNVAALCSTTLLPPPGRTVSRAESPGGVHHVPGDRRYLVDHTYALGKIHCFRPHRGRRFSCHPPQHVLCRRRVPHSLWAGGLSPGQQMQRRLTRPFQVS